MARSDPDRKLVEQAQRELPRRTRAYEELVRSHTPAVFRRCYRILQSHADAEEATQDVFMAAFRTLPLYRFERPFEHWLGTVTMNSCRMILRRRAGEQRRVEALRREPTPPAPEISADPALRRVVAELLDQLDPSNRVPLLMRFLEGDGYKEIAEQLQLTESAAKMRVARGAQRLRELYEARQAGAHGDGSDEDEDG